MVLATFTVFAAVFLFVVVNDASRMGSRVNGTAANVALYVCVAVSILLGSSCSAC